jgi:hypothetical protein
MGAIPELYHRRLRGSVLGAPHQIRNEAKGRQHDEYKEQYLGNADRPSGDTTETEYGGNQSDDKEHNSVVQHDFSPGCSFRGHLAGGVSAQPKIAPLGSGVMSAQC